MVLLNFIIQINLKKKEKKIFLLLDSYRRIPYSFFLPSFEFSC